MKMFCSLRLVINLLKSIISSLSTVIHSLTAVIVTIIIFISVSVLCSEPIYKPISLIHVKVNGRAPCEIQLFEQDRLTDLLPCAWREAQQRITKQMPAFETQIYLMRRPILALHAGLMLDKTTGIRYAGFTSLLVDPPIVIGVSGDIKYDYDTLVHELSHFIVLLSTNTEENKDRLNNWIDKEITSTTCLLN